MMAITSVDKVILHTQVTSFLLNLGPVNMLTLENCNFLQITECNLQAFQGI